MDAETPPTESTVRGQRSSGRACPADIFLLDVSRLVFTMGAQGPRERPTLLDMRVIFMDVSVGRWGLPSVEMETLLWRSPNGLRDGRLDV